METRIPDNRTIAAVEILVKLFNNEQQKLLEIQVPNGEKISLGEQLLSRGWNHIPIPETPLVFRVEAARILEVQKGWIDFMEKLKNDDIFSKLLDPDNYKEISRKKTKFKSLDKRLIDSEVDSANNVRSIGRVVGGAAGVSEAYDYGPDGDAADRERLDSIKLGEREAPMISTETGQEDDTRATDAEELGKDWMEKPERLDNVEVRRGRKPRQPAKFKSDSNIQEAEISIFEAEVTQQTNATLGDNRTDTTTFIQGLKRQAYDTTKERFILAEAINNMHNIEFMDIREKVFRKFDPLFRYNKEICP